VPQYARRVGGTVGHIGDSWRLPDSASRQRSADGIWALGPMPYDAIRVGSWLRIAGGIPRSRPGSFVLGSTMAL
jgi:hypothetical protein